LNRGEITRDQLDTEIERALGHYVGIFAKLKDHIMRKVNGQISMLAREKLNVNAYAQLRAKKENELILSENWRTFLEGLEIEFPTEEDKKAVQEMSDSELMDNTQILIEASKITINDEEESTTLGERIHALYLLCHNELEKRFPSEWVKSDGFLDYLENREKRNRKARLLEETRVTGKICPHCESTNTIKCGNAFRCKTCGRYWRKKGYV